MLNDQTFFFFFRKLRPLVAQKETAHTFFFALGLFKHRSVPEIKQWSEKHKFFLTHVFLNHIDIQ